MAGNRGNRSEKISYLKKENRLSGKKAGEAARSRDSSKDMPANKLLPAVDENSLLNTRSDSQRASLALHLQRTLGNAYVSGLIGSKAIQAKLSVSQPADPSELEADQMAERVVRGNSQIQPQEVPEEEEELAQAKVAPELQRQEEEEEELAFTRQTADIRRQEMPDEEELAQAKLTVDVQRQEEEEELMMTQAVDDPNSVSQTLENRITTLQGGGQSMNEPARLNMEQQFNSDFSGVKLHTDADADQLSRELNAEAFTVGRDIFFKQGNYQPDSDSGKRLLAHELTHVVQQEPDTTVNKKRRSPKSG